MSSPSAPAFDSIDPLREIISTHRSVPGPPLDDPEAPRVVCRSSGPSVCRAWRLVSEANHAAEPCTVTRPSVPFYSNRDVVAQFTEMLRTPPPSISFIAHIGGPIPKGLRIVTTGEIVRQAMPHFDRIQSLEVVVSRELTVSERTLWFRNPSAGLASLKIQGLPLHQLEYLHLEHVSILRASDIQWLFTNAVCLRDAVVYRGGEGIVDDYKPSSKALTNLRTLLVDPTTLEILVGIGYGLPELRVMAVPTDTGKVRWTKLPNAPKLKCLLVGGLHDDQLLGLLATTPMLNTLWLQDCVAGSAFVSGLCRKRRPGGPYRLVPKLDCLRIEGGTMNDADACELVGHRTSSLSVRRVQELGKRTPPPYPTINPQPPDILTVRPGIQDLYMVDCQNTSSTVGKAIVQRMVGSWSKRARL